MRYDFEEGLRLYGLDKLEVFHERSLDTKVGRHLSLKTGRERFLPQLASWKLLTARPCTTPLIKNCTFFLVWKALYVYARLQMPKGKHNKAS